MTDLESLEIKGNISMAEYHRQAALARDLPLLMNITILVTLVTLLANSSADVIGSMLRGQEA